MVKKQQMHRAGTVIVLGKRLRRGGVPRCRYYAHFPCRYCGRFFTSSMVHLYDPHKWRATGGVGTILTPIEQRPRWHDACRRKALRSPIQKKTCPCGCGKRFETRMPQKVYFSPEHRKAAADARRPAAEPSVVFELTPDQIEALATVVVVEADLQPEEPEADLQPWPDLLDRRVQAALEALGKAEERLAGLLAPTLPTPAALQQVVNEMSALTRERAEVDAELRGARPGAAARLQVIQKTLLQRHDALMEEKTLLQQEEADRLDARRRDASDAVDRCREDLAAAREEQERHSLLGIVAGEENDLPQDPEAESKEERELQHLRALARNGDEDARVKLRALLGLAAASSS